MNCFTPNLGHAEPLDNPLLPRSISIAVPAPGPATGAAEASVLEIVDVDDLAVLGEASAIMARLRDDTPTLAMVGEAAGLGHAALQMLLDFVLSHPESVAREALR